MKKNQTSLNFEIENPKHQFHTPLDIQIKFPIFALLITNTGEGALAPSFILPLKWRK
jgi:hypothetical protein